MLAATGDTPPTRNLLPKPEQVPIDQLPHQSPRDSEPAPENGAGYEELAGLPSRGVLSESLDDVLDALLGIAEEHGGVVAEEERVLDAGVARVHRALEHDDVLRVPHLQHRHAGDR